MDTFVFQEVRMGSKKWCTILYCGFLNIVDRTAKIWDLESGEEILTLDGHPNNVVKVDYCEETKLVFTVSNFAVKIYDMRQGPKCIQTLT